MVQNISWVEAHLVFVCLEVSQASTSVRMMRQWMAEKSVVLFNVLFVMMEGLELEFRELAWRKTCFLFFIDFFQLLRILTLPVFGWADRTSGLIEKFDIVYDFTLLGSMVMPLYVFFALAFVVVLFALVETAFVVRRFDAGSVQQMWPVKVLRFLVVALVTTLFSSLVKWLLFPLQCLVSDRTSFSEEVHGEGTDCNPFGIPELLATVPTLIVAFLYISFAFVATTFNMQVNLLSRAPRSTFTGRVELLFLLNKVAATCLVLLCKIISPTAVAAILCLLSATVFWLHSNTLPFHHHPTNVLRGGLYGASAWAAASSVIVSVTDSVSLQWALIAILPVAFLAGMWWVHRSRGLLLASLDRLRGEWEQRDLLTELNLSPKRTPLTGPRRQLEPSQGSGRHVPGSASKDPSMMRSDSILSLGVKSTDSDRRRGGPRPQNPLERFYDVTGEKRRIFVSGRHALACARVLLYERRAEDRPFLEYIIDRGLEDFREYRPLQIFRILVMSMVLESQRAAVAEVKRMRDSGDSLPVDLRYLLYCFDRKTAQDSAAENLGRHKGGQISAINLMEFNLGLAKAKAAHRRALLAIKHAWRTIIRITRGTVNLKTADRAAGWDGGEAGRSGAQAVIRNSKVVGSYEEVVKQLEECVVQAREASGEYRSLLFKFPTSVELLFSYAAFLDVCLNDSAEADTRLAQAVALQEGDGSDDGRVSREDERPRISDDGKSATSGDSSVQDKRKLMARWLQGWEARIMGAETKQLRALVWRVKLATLLLVATATAAFVVSDFVLFQGMTKSEMHRVTSIGELYTEAVVITATLRSLFLGALHHSHLTSFAEVQAQGLALVKDMQDKVVFLHSHLNLPEAEEYFNHRKFTTVVPTAGGWKEDHSTLWEVGNAFTTRAQLALSVSEEDLRNETWRLASLSDQRRNVPYLWENTLSVMVPTLEELKKIYVHEMDVIQHTVDLLVLLNTTSNSLLVVLITALVLRGLLTVVYRMEGKALVCRLMASLPHQTAKQILQHYRKAEAALQEIEDEDAERKALVGDDDDGDRRSGNTSPYVLSMLPRPQSPWREKLHSAMPPLNEEEPAEREAALPDVLAPGSSSTESGKHPDSNIRLLSPRRSRTTPLRVYASSPLLPQDGGGVQEDSEGFQAPTVLPLTAANIESLVQNSEGGEGLARRKSGSDSADMDTPREMATTGDLGVAERVVLVRRPGEKLVQEGGREGGEGREDGLSEEEEEEAEGQEDQREDQDVASADQEGLVEEKTAEEGDEGEAAEGHVGKDEREEDGAKKVRSVHETDQEEAPYDEKECQGLMARVRPGAKRQELDSRVGSEIRGEEGGGVLGALREMKAASLNGDVEPHNRQSILRQPLNSPSSRPGVSFWGSSRDLRQGSIRDSANSGKSSQDRRGVPSPLDSFRRNGHGSGRHLIAPGGGGGSFSQKALGNGFSSDAPHAGVVTVTDEDKAAAAAVELEEALKRRRPWFIWTSTWLAMFAVVTVLCVVSTVVATRDFGHLIALAPIVKEAGARVMLVKAGGMLARELVLDDGFSLRSRQELSDGLAFALQEMRHADRALRLGDDTELGIDQGADKRNPLHNHVMYGSVCPWTEPEWQAAHTLGVAASGGHRRRWVHRREGNAHGNVECKDPAKPEVGDGGLLSVLVAYEDALESILHRYGLPPDAEKGAEQMLYHDNALEYLAETSHLVEEWMVHVREDRVRALAEDDDVAFVLASVDGYLAQGLLFVMELFDHELDEILEEAIHLNEILFALYVLTLVLVFWYCLFRKTVAYASEEAATARCLVRRMPLHILTQDEVDDVSRYFQEHGEDDGVMDDDHMRSPSGASSHV